MLAGRLTERDLPVLERVLARLDRAEIKSLAVKTASFDMRDEFRLRFYAVLKRIGVPGVPPHIHALANSDLHLALGNGEFSRRLDDFFFAAGRSPEWENVLPLLTKEERAALLHLVPETTRRVVKRRLLSRAGAVKSFSRLALADPENRELWLKLAAQYDTVPGEASLWHLDALEGEAKRQLSDRLRRAGRLPPVRERNTPNNQHKE